MSIIQGTSKAAGGFYTIDQSTRFNDDDSAYLTRTPGSASSHTTFTFSMWIKRCQTGNMRLFSTAFGVSNKEDEIYFENLDRLQWQSFNGGSYGFRLLSKAVYRDFSAWMHIVAVLDSTNGTAADRQRLYVNGERITAFAAEVQASASYASSINNTQAHYFSRYYASAVDLFDGYMAEIHFIDGIAVDDPTSFGKVDSITGQWVPIEYTGSYGSNGFYITGEDSADLGADYSGNGNDFTSSGLTSADQMLDTPTDSFCTLNSVDKATQVTLADGNLQYGLSSNSYTAVRGTFGVSSGKWYWEMSTVSGMGLNTCYVGITTNASNLQVSAPPTDGTTYTYISYTGNKAYTSSTSYGDTWNTNGRVIGVALDLDAGKIWWSRDGVWQASGDPAAGTNEAFSGITGTWHPYVVFNDTSPNLLFNFGQSAFTYTPPTDFVALSTANLPDPTIADPSAYMQTTLYTGNGTAIGSGGNAVDQSGNSTFQPDFVWIKNRSAADNHMLYDAVRGATKDLHSNTTDAEATDTEGLSIFDADGFTVGSNVEVNTNTENYTAWQWKANGSGSSNTDGSVTSTVSVNTTAGFSICTTSGSGGAGTFGHGLGVTPSLIIPVRRTSADSRWIFHQAIGPTKGIPLDSASTPTTSVNFWNDTSPTSSIVNVGNTHNNSGDTYVFYCFAEVEGFSKFGSYVGNASSDGPFVYCGFRPAWVLIRQATTSARDWIIQDATRNPYNVANLQLLPNTTEAEATTFYSQSAEIDILSNGFKVRSSAARVSESGATYIVAAFAESPFKTATAR